MKKIKLPEILTQFYTKNKRYKVAYGGRGSAKSWTIARILLLKGVNTKLRILCAREIQKSIKKSVHKLLSDQIHMMNLEKFYTIKNDSIVGMNGTEFFFEGLHHNVHNIKSIEGIDICWIEEAENISKESWSILTPTIRKKDSEIWVSFNPKNENDYIYQLFVENEPPENSLVIKVNYFDNPWFPEVLNNERIHIQKTDSDLYNHVWLGECEKHSHAQIFNNKWVVADFKTPQNATFYHGLDLGFAGDPTVIARTFISGNTLYIDKAEFIYHAELSELPEWLLGVCPTTEHFTIRCDNDKATLSYLRRAGFDIRPATKGKGSIKAGIKYLRSFDKIVIHERLSNMIEEARLYKYKVDPMTGDILPIILDTYNHGWDAVRYSLSRHIKTGTNQ